MMISIRKARLNDLETMLILENELYNHEYQLNKELKPEIIPDFPLKKDSNKYLKDFIKKMIRSPNGLVLLSEVDSKIAGYLIIMLKKNIPIFQLERLGELTDLYIRDKYRGLGISTKLLNEAITWCKTKKITRITLDVFPENSNAQQVYSHWGFNEFILEMRYKIK
jgi:ribosomal-protein-alanine N-acetyltransferase